MVAQLELPEQVQYQLEVVLELLKPLQAGLAGPFLIVVVVVLKLEFLGPSFLVVAQSFHAPRFVGTVAVRSGFIADPFLTCLPLASSAAIAHSRSIVDHLPLVGVDQL